MESHPERILRVGSVPFAVGRPLDVGLEREAEIRLRREEPAQLVDGLRSGALDVALCSSIELFRQPGYGYLAGLAVAGLGRVSSVALFLRGPLDATRRIALDPASRTSAVLAEIVLRERGVTPEWLELQPGQDPSEADADGWLRIGDRALVEWFTEAAPVRVNLSELWCASHGLAFVFACWIVRGGVDLGPHAPAFARSRAAGRRRVEEFADDLARHLELAPVDMRRYLGEECRYELDPAAQAASLARFQQQAAALGRARADLAPRALVTPPAPA